MMMFANMPSPKPEPEPEEQPPYELPQCHCCREARIALDKPMRDKVALVELTANSKSTVLVCPSCDGITVSQPEVDNATQ